MRFAVAMCTRDGEPFVREQLRSILEQTQPPQDVVVCDDCSTDGTVAAVQEVADELGAPVRVVENRSVLGVAPNFEQAMRLARGDVIVLSDQDDRWEPNRLERLAEEFRSPSTRAVFSDATVIDRYGQPTGATLWQAIEIGRRDRLRLAGGRAFDVAMRRNVFTGAALALRSDLLDVLLPLHPRAAHDHAVAIASSALDGLVVIPDRLVQYRVHASNQAGVSRGLLGHPPRDPRWRGIDRRMIADLRDRLEAGGAPRAAVDALAAKIAFLDHRVALPGSRARRAAPVLRHTINGGYWRYANGWRSVAGDLVYGT